MTKHDHPVPKPPLDPEKFKHLPERIDPADMVTTQETDPPQDPEGGRDTDRDFVIRYD